MDTLSDIVKNGFTQDQIKGVLKKFEFYSREIKTSLGLRLMRRCIRGWLYGYSPEVTLTFSPYIDRVKKLSKKSGYFEGLVKKYLIENNHRSDVSIEPTLDEETRQKDLRNNKLNSFLNELTITELDNLKRENRAFQEFQKRADSEEDLRSLPGLEVEDIPFEVKHIDTIVTDIKGVKLFKNRDFTNGITYLGFGFNLDRVDKFFFNYLNIFNRAFTQCGFKDKDYKEVAILVNSVLGGISTSMETSNTLVDGKPGGYIENFYLRTKFLSSNYKDALKLFNRFLTYVDFSDHDRLKNIIIEAWNDLKGEFVSNGTTFACVRSARKYSLASCREDAWYGISQGEFLKELVEDIDNRIEEVSDVLRLIKDQVITRDSLFIHLSPGSKDLERQLENSIKILPQSKMDIQPVEHYDILDNLECWYGDTDVSYNSLTVRGAFLGTRENSVQRVAAHLIRNGYLWEKVRMEGGAYGAFLSSSSLDGSLTFGSYRDPNTQTTLDHFKHSLEELAAGHIKQDDIDNAIISIVGRELKPMTPVEKSLIGPRRILLGVTNEIREMSLDYLKGITIEDIADFAAAVLHYWDDASITVISSKEKCEE